MLQATQQEAIDKISKTINKFAIAKTLVFVSGGSSAKIAVEALKKIEEKNRQNITVILADERYVDYNSADSNGALLNNLGIKNYCKEFVEILNQNKIDGKLLAQNFCINLEKQINEARNTVAIFGIGTNNHIAGIFPGSIAAKSNDKMAVFYKAEDFERITITPPVFEKINVGFVYAEDKIKQNSILTISQNFDTISHPSQLIKKCKEFEIFFNKEGL